MLWFVPASPQNHPSNLEPPGWGRWWGWEHPAWEGMKKNLTLGGTTLKESSIVSPLLRCFLEFLARIRGMLYLRAVTGGCAWCERPGAMLGSSAARFVKPPNITASARPLEHGPET